MATPTSGSNPSEKKSVKPLIPLRTSDESTPDPREYEDRYSRDAQIRGDKPPHHG